MANPIFVNSAWAGCSYDDPVFVGDNMYTFGTDAFADIQEAVKNADADGAVIKVLAGTYAGNVTLSKAGIGKDKTNTNMTIQAYGDGPVNVTGTFQIGAQDSGTPEKPAGWQGGLTIEGINFDSTNNTSIQMTYAYNVTVKDCTFGGDAEKYMVNVPTTASGDGNILFTGCEFGTGRVQIYRANISSGRGIEFNDCDFDESTVNVQGGNDVKFSDCDFTKTLTDYYAAHSFYVIRSNATGITINGGTINVKSTASATTVPETAGDWAVLWERKKTTDPNTGADNTPPWTVTGLTVNYDTNAANNNYLLFNNNDKNDNANQSNRITFEDLTTGTSSAATVDQLLAKTSGYVIVEENGSKTLYDDGTNVGSNDDIFVNASWTSTTVPEGKVWGFNAFNSFTNAYNAVAANGTITVSGDTAVDGTALTDLDKAVTIGGTGEITLGTAAVSAAVAISDVKLSATKLIKGTGGSIAASGTVRFNITEKLDGEFVSIAANSTIDNSTIAAGNNIGLDGKTDFTGVNSIAGIGLNYYNCKMTVDDSEGKDNKLTVTEKRLTFGYDLTFDVTGKIAAGAALTADKNDVDLTLDYKPGFSIRGGGTSYLNVKNARVSFGDTSVRQDAATGTYNYKFTNSIVDFTNQFGILAGTGTAANVPKTTVTVDGSVVTISGHLKNNQAIVKNSSGQIQSGSTVILKNSSKMTVNLSLQNYGDLQVLSGSQMDVKSYTNSSHGGQTGTVTVSGTGSTFTMKNTASDNQWLNSGTISVLAGGALDVAYITNNEGATIALDGASTLTGSQITNNGTITIDGSNLAPNTAKKVIDLSQNAALANVTVSDNVKALYGDDGDVIIHNISQTTLYVNSAWTGYAVGDAIVGETGKYYGINAFANFTDAYYAAENNGTITICSDVDGTGLPNLGNYYTKNLTFVGAGENGARYNITLSVPLQVEATWTVGGLDDEDKPIATNIGFAAGLYKPGLNIRSNTGTLVVTDGATADLGYLYDRGTIEVNKGATLKAYYGLLPGTKSGEGDPSVLTINDAQLVFDSNSYNLEGHFGNSAPASGVINVVLTDGKIIALETVLPGIVFDATATVTATASAGKRSEITAATKITNSGTLNLSSTDVSACTTITNSGAITIDTDSTITAASIDNSAEGASIAIDATDLAANSTVKVIDITGTAGFDATKVSVTGEGVRKLQGKDGDVFVTNETASTYYVNAAWADAEIGELVTLADGETKVKYGIAAFSKLSDAYAAAYAHTGTEDIYVESDITGDNFDALLNVNVLNGTADGEEVSITNTYGGWLYMGYSTIGEGVALTNPLGAFANNSFTVSGSLTGRIYHGYDSVITVTETGYLGKGNEAVIIRYNKDSSAGIYVTGTAAPGAEEKVRTLQFDANYFSFYSGTVSLKDTLAQSGPMWINAAQDIATYPDYKVFLKLDNALYKTNELRMTGDATLEMKNKSVMTTLLNTDQNQSVTLNEGAKADINTGSQLTGKNVTNAGTITVDGTSTITATNEFTNSGAINITAGGTITAQSFTNSGTITIDVTGFTGTSADVITVTGTTGDDLTGVTLDGTDADKYAIVTKGKHGGVSIVKVGEDVYIWDECATMAPGTEVTINSTKAHVGIDAFATIDDALTILGKTIYFKSSDTVAKTQKIITGNLNGSSLQKASDAAADVTVTMGGDKLTDNMLTGSLTIGAGVTFAATKLIHRSTTGEDEARTIMVNGTYQAVGNAYLYAGIMEVNGKLTGDDVFLNGNGGTYVLNVNGGATATEQVDVTSLRIGAAAIANFTDTIVKATTLNVTAADGVINASNTTINGNVTNAGTFNVKTAATITSIENNGIINVQTAEATITGNVVNKGTINATMKGLTIDGNLTNGDEQDEQSAQKSVITARELTVTGTVVNYGAIGRQLNPTTDIPVETLDVGTLENYQQVLATSVQANSISNDGSGYIYAGTIETTSLTNKSGEISAGATGDIVGITVTGTLDNGVSENVNVLPAIINTGDAGSIKAGTLNNKKADSQIITGTLEAGTVTNDGEISVKATAGMTVTNSVTNNATGQIFIHAGSKLDAASVSNAGTINVANGAAINADIANSGTISVDGNVTVTGAITNDGAITINAATSLLTATSIASSGTITIDVTDFSGMKKIIDLDGEITGTVDPITVVGGSASWFYNSADSAYYLTSVDQSNLYVNIDWSTASYGEEVGGAGSGKYYGFNAFSALQGANGALAVAMPRTAATTITFEGTSFSENYGDDIMADFSGDVEFKGIPVTLNQTAGGRMDLCISPAAETTATISTPITAVSSNSLAGIWLNYRGAGTTQVSSAITAKDLIAINSNVIVDEDATLTTAAGNIQFGRARDEKPTVLSITGTGTFGTDEYQVSALGLQLSEGTVTVTDSKIKADYLSFTDTENLSNFGGYNTTINLTSTDTTWVVKEMFARFYTPEANITADNATLTFNGGSLNIEGALVNEAWKTTNGQDKVSKMDGPVMDMTFNGATLTAASIANDGTIALAASSTATVTGAITGTGTITVDASTLSFGGDITIDTLTLSNGGTVAPISGERVLKIGTLTGTITVNADATLTGSSVGGGTLEVADGTTTIGTTATTFGDVSNAGTIILDGENTTTTFGMIGGSGSINMDWHDMLTFSGFETTAGTSSIVFDLAGFDPASLTEDQIVLTNVGAAMTVDDYENYVTMVNAASSDFGHYFKVDNNNLVLRSDVADVIYVDPGNPAHDIDWAVEQAQEQGATLIDVRGGSFSSADFFGIDTVIEDGEFTSTRVTGGEIASLPNKKTYLTTEGDRTFIIEGGSFAGVVHAGDRLTTAGHLLHGDIDEEECGPYAINMTISGGSFASNVAGGMMLDYKNSTGDVSQYGDINLKITGGSFAKFIYGGNVSSNKNYSDQTEVTGDITVTFDMTDAEEKDTPITVKSVVAGSYGDGHVYGSTKVVLKGNGEYLTISSQLWGGCSSDYYVIQADGSKKANSKVVEVDEEGEVIGSVRTLSFEGFTGVLDVKSIKMFSDISFDAETAVTFTSKFAGTLAEIDNWRIAYGSKNTGAFQNDFSGDSLWLTGLDGELAEDWVIFDNTSRFTNITDAGAGFATINGEEAVLTTDLLEGELCAYDLGSYTLAFTEASGDKASQMILRNAIA